MNKKRILYGLIQNGNYKVISFNVFDTLLLRPVFDPSDVLYLLAEKTEKEYGIDFQKVRVNAEQIGGKESGAEQHTLRYIYNKINEKFKNKKNICDLIFENEMLLQRNILSVREDIKELYDLAINQKKRVIAITDTFLPGEVLGEILKEKGYDRISEVYASSDYNKRKDTGALYKAVLENERLAPEEIFHIGSDFNSDYLKPNELYINSFHIPSINEIVFHNNSGFSSIWPDRLSTDPFAGIVAAFALNHYFSGKNRVNNYGPVFDNLQMLGFVGIGPVLFYICIRLLSEKQIQEKYSALCFLPEVFPLIGAAYDIMHKKISSRNPNYIPSLKISDANSDNESKSDRKKPAVFFHGVFSSDDNGIISKTEQDIILLFRQRGSFKSKKSYGKIKHYIFPEMKNLKNDIPYLEVLLSSIFSSVVRTSGFFSGITSDPAFHQNKPYDVNQDLDDKKIIQQAALKFINLITDVYSDYLQHFKIKNPEQLLIPLVYSIGESSYNDEVLLRNIISDDPSTVASTLSYRMLLHKRYDNVFTKTGFNNEKNYIFNKRRFESEVQYKIGMHLHLYSYNIYGEIIEYLADFPAFFDLIITITDTRNETNIKAVFNSGVIPRLAKLVVLVVPNRGRDVAPWLINTGEFQDSYDLFCHLHSKESRHFEWGGSWRKYLFDQLISAEAFTEIYNLFAVDEKLGLLFPPFYDELKKFCISYRIDPGGEYGEEKIINELLRKMDINKIYERADILYSGGTMFWYRPAALKPFFNLNLTVDDFPEEPIGVGGTLAHAIERMPVIICEAQGYKGGMHMSERELYRRYSDFNSGIEIKLARGSIIIESWSSKTYLHFKKIINFLLPHGTARRRYAVRFLK